MAASNRLSTILLAPVFALVVSVGLAEPLRPSAGQRVVANASAVTAELREVVQADDSREGEELKALVDTGTDWRVYYRDRQLLFAIPVRKNLLASEKVNGEREAAELARVVLQQNFSRMLALEDGSQGLDADSVRVVFIEPDVENGYARGAMGGRSTAAGVVGPPLPFASYVAWTGQPAVPAACGCH
jgi:hypothetical protein